jgi:hypothetical protein
MPTPHSIWLTSHTDVGSVADNSLSAGQLYMSVSLWVKITAPETGGAVLMSTQDITTGHGGWLIQILQGAGAPPEGDGQLEWYYINVDQVAPLPHSPAYTSGQLYGLIGHANPTLIDGNWHNIVTTYDGTGVTKHLLSVPDGTHLEVNDTTGILAGDRISQTFYSTTVVTVVDGTHLEVTNSTGFNPINTGGSDQVDTRGLIMYVDGTPIFAYADYQFPAFGADYTGPFNFSIGDPQQQIKTRIAKYAYPALYYGTVLTPSQVSTIAAGNNLGGATAQWLFEEGLGLTAADNSGNGHTLTFNAIGSWDTDVPFSLTPPSTKKADMFLVF